MSDGKNWSAVGGDKDVLEEDLITSAEDSLQLRESNQEPETNTESVSTYEESVKSPLAEDIASPVIETKASVKEDLIGFFTRPLLSKKKTDQLKELVTEGDKIHQRMNEVESGFRELVKSTISLSKTLVRSHDQLCREMTRNQSSHEETIQKSIDVLKTGLDVQSSKMEQFQNMVLNKIDFASGKVAGVDSSLIGIRDYLAESTKLTQRLQEGYDFHILKNFVLQIARTIGFLEKQVENSNDENVKRELGEAVYDLVQLLERNGIEQICPEIGTPFDGLRKYAEALTDKVPSVDGTQKGQIASVERVGYKYEFNDGQERIIQPAKVKLYE